MEAFTLLLVLIVVLFIATGSYFLARRTVSAPAVVNAGREPAGESAIELARLQEREKTLMADIGRQATEIHRLNEAAIILQKDRTESRERAATAEERAVGLQQELSTERKHHDTSRTALMADLASATDARDRLQILFAEASQKLVAAAQMETEIRRLNEAAGILQKDRAESRERAATAEERAAGLQEALSTERKNNDASRTALMADLASATDSRDRLQISFAEASQKLAAAAPMETEIRRLNEAAVILQKDRAESRERAATAEERVAGLQQTLSTERKNNDASRTALMADLASAMEARDRLQISLAEASQKLAAAAQMEQEIRGRLGHAEDRIAQRNSKIGGLEESLDNLRTQLAEKDRVLSAFSERENALNRALAERNQQFTGLQEQMKSEFENIANKVLAATASQLSEKSQDRLIAILDPLKTRLNDIQQKVESGQLEDTRQRAALGEQIRQAAQINQAIGLEAQNLAKALKGDSQTPGRWGEMRLERILEKSGLERGREFQIQGRDFAVGNEDGARQRPDVVILLPEDRHFVIDSKVSLIDYLEYEAADSDELRAKSLKKLLSSIRAHIDDLAGKKYQYANAINSHDLVFMFIPIEGVTALVLRNDESIFDYAWNRKIVITSPSTLFMTMRTVGSIWRYERQGKSAQAIADQAGELYDKLVAVVADLNDVTQKIQAASDAHNAAMKKLATGRGNTLARAEKLKSLGVSSKKEFPGILLDGAEHVVDTDDDEPLTLVERARKQLERPKLS